MRRSSAATGGRGCSGRSLVSTPRRERPGRWRRRSTPLRVSGGHGPYRFNDTRTDFRFYLDNATPYYRLVEMAVPQAISQWYLGSGGTVGFSTITGMAALDHLMTLRKTGTIDFRVWPQEGLAPEEDKHVIVESYPAIYPEPSDYGECTDEHCRDAWRVLQWMLGHKREKPLADYFRIAPVPFGRTESVSFEQQVRFEGWILGVLQTVRSS